MLLGILGILLAAGTLWAVVFMFSFLISNMNATLDIQFTPPEPVRFDIQGFEQLHLIPEAAGTRQ